MPLLSLIPLLGYSLAVKRRLGIEASFALILSVSSWLLLAYVFGLAGFLKEGAIALWVLGLVAFLVESPQLLRSLREKTFSPVLGLFVLFCLAFWFVHHDSQYFYFDEYSHWGVFIKDLWYFDRFWQADSNAWHPHYLPGAPLWQYALTQFSPEVESTAYFAQFILLIAPLMVLYERLSLRQLGWAAAITLIIIIGLANFGHSVASLYVDHVIATWFAGVLILGVFQHDLDWKKLMLLFPALIVMALLKDVGIGFALAAAGLVSALVLFRYYGDGLSAAFGKSLALGVVLLLPSLIAVAAWSANRDAAGIEASSYSLSGVLSTAGEDSAPSPDAAIIKERFVYVFQHQQLSKDEVSANYNAFSFPIVGEFQDAFRLTTLNFYLLFSLFFIVILALKGPGQPRVEWGIVAAGLLFTAVSYTVVMYISYQVAFGERGPLISSYIRYVHSVVLAMFLFGFAALMPQSRLFTDKSISVSDRQVPITVPVFASLALMMLVFETPYLRGFTSPNPQMAWRTQMEPLLSELNDRFDDRRVWIFLPTDRPNGIFGQIMQFLIAPTPTTVERSTSFLMQEEPAIREQLSRFDILWFPAENPELDERVGSVLGLEMQGRYVSVQRGASGSARFELYEFD